MEKIECHTVLSSSPLPLTFGEDPRLGLCILLVDTPGPKLGWSMAYDFLGEEIALYRTSTWWLVPCVVVVR